MKKTLFFLLLIFGTTLYFKFPENEWDFLKGYVENGELTTFELTYTPEEIEHRQAYSYEYSLVYLPCLLLDVKYANAHFLTKEESILFSMVHGEMILNTNTWTLSRGYGEAMNEGLNSEEISALRRLSTKSANFKEDQNLAYALLSLKKKKLVIEKSGNYTIHMESPFFNIPPRTRMLTPLVSKPYNPKDLLPKQFSSAQIKSVVLATFKDRNISIKDSTVIYLPVAKLTRHNIDGSFVTTYWSCLTANEITL